MTTGTLELGSRGWYGIRGAMHAYSSVPVLLDVDFELHPASIHALVGENGAGKSTLIKILFGAERPVRGQLYLDGEPISLHSPADALRRGIAVVHQDVQLFPDLDVAKNVYGVGRPLPRRRLSRTIDWDAVHAQVGEVFATLGVEVPVRQRVGSLNPVHRRMIEIARAMMETPRFLILDEPTASLEPHAAGVMLDLLLRLRGEGLGILFVSHRLDEIRRVADEVTVLRDGCVAGRLSGQPHEDEMAALMLGASAETVRGARKRPNPQEASTAAEPAIEVEGLLLPGGDRPVDLTVRRGEVFGLTGLIGSGAETIVRMLGGAERPTGRVSVLGRPVSIDGPQDALAAGIGFVPEDRLGEGIVPSQSVAVNMALSSLRDLSVAGVLRRGQLRGRARSYRDRLAIRAASLDVPVVTLSGGNQQKVLIARCLSSGAAILAIEEPTHGVDIGAKAQIHEMLRSFAAAGGTVIVSSTDIGELLNLCDRIGVCKHGTLSAVLSAHEAYHADVLLIGLRDPGKLVDELMREEQTIERQRERSG